MHRDLERRRRAAVGRHGDDLHLGAGDVRALGRQLAQGRGHRRHGVGGKVGQLQPRRRLTRRRRLAPADGEAGDRRPAPGRHGETDPHTFLVHLPAEQGRHGRVHGAVAGQAALQRRDRPGLAGHQQRRDVADAHHVGRQVRARRDPDDLDVLADPLRLAEGHQIAAARGNVGVAQVREQDRAGHDIARRRRIDDRHAGDDLIGQAKVEGVGFSRLHPHRLAQSQAGHQSAGPQAVAHRGVGRPHAVPGQAHAVAVAADDMPDIRGPAIHPALMHAGAEVPAPVAIGALDRLLAFQPQGLDQRRRQDVVGGIGRLAIAVGIDVDLVRLAALIDVLKLDAQGVDRVGIDDFPAVILQVRSGEQLTRRGLLDPRRGHQLRPVPEQAGAAVHAQQLHDRILFAVLGQVDVGLPVILVAQRRPGPQADVGLRLRQWDGGGRTGHQPARDRGRVRRRRRRSPRRAVPGLADGRDPAGEGREVALVQRRRANRELDQRQGLIQHRLAESDGANGRPADVGLALGVVVFQLRPLDLELVPAERQSQFAHDAPRIAGGGRQRNRQAVRPSARSGRHAVLVDRPIADCDGQRRGDLAAVILREIQALRHEEVELEPLPLGRGRADDSRRSADGRRQLFLKVQLVGVVGHDREGAGSGRQVIGHAHVAGAHGTDQGVADLQVFGRAGAVVQAEDAVNPLILALRLGEGLYGQIRRDHHLAQRHRHGRPGPILVRGRRQGVAIVHLGDVGLGLEDGGDRHLSRRQDRRRRDLFGQQGPGLEGAGRAADPHADRDDRDGQQDLADVFLAATAA